MEKWFHGKNYNVNGVTASCRIHSVRIRFGHLTAEQLHVVEQTQLVDVPKEASLIVEQDSHVNSLKVYEVRAQGGGRP